VYEPTGGKQRVEIYIRLDQSIEGMRVGIAIDASASMKPPHRCRPQALRPANTNNMQSIIRGLARSLCTCSGDGTVDLIYWALGRGGAEVEAFSRVDASGCESLEVSGPSGGRWGTGTRLQPAMAYFLEEFAESPRAFILFITDGVIEDFEDVKATSMEAGWEILDGKRGDLTMVLVGAGFEVDMDQLDAIDDMFDGTDLGEQGVDLWDTKTDEVDFGIQLPGAIKISDADGNILLSHADGFPQRLEFQVPEACESFTVEVAGQTIVQPLVD